MNFNFNNYKKCEMFQSDAENKKELTEEEILNSNNVDLMVEYAKKNRSKVAIDKVRELLESSRKTGEEVVQNFLSSFKECEEEKMNYLDFENTESGKMALDLLEKMPEPFKSNAYKKLDNYKKELEYNTELLSKYKNDPEKIWKEIFGFNYYNIKERFKNFLFTNVKTLSKKYYENSTLEVKQDPFSINFFIEDKKMFHKTYGKDMKNSKLLGFSMQGDKTHYNVIKTDKLKNIDKVNSTIIHESEHAVHEKVNPLEFIYMKCPELDLDDFNENKVVINNEMREFLLNNLKLIKDEVFAFQKAGSEKKITKKTLLYKIKEPLFKERSERNGSSIVLDEIRKPNDYYDYNEIMRESNYKWIELSNNLSESEKQQLRDAIDFLQSEYDRVLKNMIDIVYEGNHSVEFFRNVPINELWKYSDGKYSRTDFIIKEFKF